MKICYKKRAVCRGFHNAIQSGITNVHPSVWKLIFLSIEERILVKNKKCNAEQGNKIRKECIKCYEWKTWKTDA